MATRAQIAAARKNIKKAHAARRGNGRSRKATPAQKRALAKARAARKRNLAKPGHRKHTVRAFSYRRKAKRVHVPKHLSRETPSPKPRRKKSRSHAAAPTRRTRTRTKTVYVTRHKRSRRAAALENPLSGVELFVGGLTGLLGFAVADVTDRFVATHALTDKNAKDAAGNELYADDTAQDGAYKGLYNATAVLAPMNLARWGAGLAITAVPLVVAQFIKAPVGRSALQFFGFGAGFRVFGKASQDLFAMLLVKTGFGQRLYDGEMRAAALKNVGGDTNNSNFTGGSLPSAGLGAPDEPVGCGRCAPCVTGVGACCGKAVYQDQPSPGHAPEWGPAPTPAAAPPPPVGAGAPAPLPAAPPPAPPQGLGQPVADERIERRSRYAWAERRAA